MSTTFILAVCVAWLGGCSTPGAQSPAEGGQEEAAESEPQRPDDSLDALVGTYHLEEVRGPDADIGRDCVKENAPLRAGGRVALEPFARGGTTASGSEDTPEAPEAAPSDTTDRRSLAVSACETGDCQRSSRWHTVLEKADGYGWSGISVDAQPVSDAPMVRRCRLTWSATTVVPEESGIRLERQIRTGVVTLEGDASCQPETAAEFKEALGCVRRVVWKGRPQATTSGSVASTASGRR